MIRTALGCFVAIITGFFLFMAWIVSQFDSTTWDTIGWLAMWAGRAALVLAGVAGLLFIDWIRHRRERRDRTMIDGSWQLKKYRVREWNKEVPPLFAIVEYIIGHPGELDRNRVNAPAYYLRNGKLIEQTPAAGWEIQHAYNLAVERTNIVRATFTGDDARRHWFGRDAQQGKLPAATLRAPVMPALPPPPEDDIVDAEYKPMPTNLEDALKMHHPGDSQPGTILLAQNNAGESALWNPWSDPHLGVWGKSGQGKTEGLGMTIAIGQLRQNWRALIIDPEQEGDTPSGAWGTLAPWAEVISPGEPGCGLWEKVLEWYEARWRNIQAQGATDAYHMPNGKALRPLAIHFDELSRWRDEGHRKGGAWAKYVAETDNALAEIAQRGRKRGVHLTIYGQLPGELPEQLAGGLVNVTFKQPENQGNKVGYWHAHQLKKGQFAFEGQVYNAFAPLLEAPAILGNRTPPKPLLTGVPNAERSPNGGVSQAEYTPTPERSVNRTVTLDPTDLQKSVWTWRDANPLGSQAEMRAAFDAQSIKISRGYASDLYNIWPGATNGASHD